MIYRIAYWGFIGFGLAGLLGYTAFGVPVKNELLLIMLLLLGVFSSRGRYDRG